MWPTGKSLQESGSALGPLRIPQRETTIASLSSRCMTICRGREPEPLRGELQRPTRARAETIEGIIHNQPWDENARMSRLTHPEQWQTLGVWYHLLHSGVHQAPKPPRLQGSPQNPYVAGRNSGKWVPKPVEQTQRMIRMEVVWEERNGWLGPRQGPGRHGGEMHSMCERVGVQCWCRTIPSAKCRQGRRRGDLWLSVVWFKRITRRGGRWKVPSRRRLSQQCTATFGVWPEMTSHLRPTRRLLVSVWSGEVSRSCVLCVLPRASQGPGGPSLL